jgi:hypothetical protein
MSEVTGLAASDVVVGAALVLIVPLCALAFAPIARTRRRPSLSFAGYWLLLLASAALLTSAVVNLTLAGSPRFWLAAGGAGVIGILVTFARGPGLWSEPRAASDRTTSSAASTTSSAASTTSSVASETPQVIALRGSKYLAGLHLRGKAAAGVRPE